MFYEIITASGLGLFWVLSFTSYRYAVFLLAALLPTYLLRLNIFGIPTTFLELATWLVLLAGLTQPVVRMRWVQQWYALSPAFKIFAALFIISATLSAGPNQHSLGILKGWIITPVLWGWLVATRGQYMRPLLLSGVTVSIIGLFQLSHWDRIQSVYDTPNSLALFIVPLIVLGFSSNSFLNKLTAFVMSFALLATQSVGGIIALGVTLLVSGFLKKKSLPAIFLLFVIIAIIFFPRIYYFFSDQPTSLTVRWQLWQASAELIKSHPLVGIGLGRFEPAYQQVIHQWFMEKRPGTLPEFVFRDPHNWILSFWLNTGLLGLLSFVGLHGVASWRYFPLSLSRERAGVWVVTQGNPHPNLLPIQGEGRLKPYALALLSLLVFGLVDTIYWKNDLASLQWLLLFSLLFMDQPAEHLAPVAAKQIAD